MAKIAVIEDREVNHNLVDLALQETEHEVVAEAYNWEEAVGLIGRLASGELKLDAVLLDGNFSNRNRVETEDSEDCPDAIAWLDELGRAAADSEANLHIVIAGFSSFRIPDKRVIDFRKDDSFVSRLPDFLDSLPELARVA